MTFSISVAGKSRLIRWFEIFLSPLPGGWCILPIFPRDVERATSREVVNELALLP